MSFRNSKEKATVPTYEGIYESKDRMNTIETTALISDFTTQDRIDALNSLFYIEPKIEFSKEENKENEDENLSFHLFVHKFNGIFLINN